MLTELPCVPFKSPAPLTLYTSDRYRHRAGHKTFPNDVITSKSTNIIHVCKLLRNTYKTFRQAKRLNFHTHAMKGYMGSRGIAPHTLKLCTRYRRLGGLTPSHLYPCRNSPHCTLNRRLLGLRGDLDILGSPAGVLMKIQVFRDVTSSTD